MSTKQSEQGQHDVDGNIWKSTVSARKPKHHCQANDLATLLMNIQKLFVEHLFRGYGKFY